MPFITYEEKNLRPRTMWLIGHAQIICQEYQDAGYDLTLRQLYYQFVARGLIPNRQAEYNKLGDAVSAGRMCGHLDWDWINDRTRNIAKRAQWEHPREIILAAAKQFHLDYWKDQDVHVEVWVEKEALAGVVESVTRPLDVTSLACRGYLSQSEAWAAGQRFVDLMNEHDKDIVVLHLGDHDPSGMDMSRDNRERISDFIDHHDYSDRSYRLERIALNWDQIQTYRPPPNPAKVTDSRFDKYEEEFGDESWELDALPPDVLADLIRTHILDLADMDKFAAAQAREAEYRDRVHRLLDEHGNVLEVAS